VPQVPLCENAGTASHYFHRTGQAAVGAYIPDQLTRSKRHSGVAAKNSFEVAGYDDNGLGYVLPLFENNLAGRAVDPPARLTNLRNSRLSIELNATR